jgi:hypothetical protein
LSAGNQCVHKDTGGTGGDPSSGTNGPQIPDGAHISLDCRPYNIPAYTYSDCLYSHYCGQAHTVPCTMKLADHDGVVIKAATTVGFRSEAGDISPAATSPAYDPPASLYPDQEDLGHAVGFLEVCNAPLPFDVDPLPNEFSLESVDLGCGPRTTNPRDGLVTVIAWVRGEEGYVDQNRNGRYDAGEPFIDLGEPYLDVNDNGQWDPGEWFLDVNGNGVYDGPNGKWDSDTIIWTQARVVYTGFPAYALDANGNQLFSGDFSSDTLAGPAASFMVHLGPPPTTQRLYAFFTDEHLNPPSSFTNYGASSTKNVSVAMSSGLPVADSLGMSFRLLYCPQQTVTAACEEGPADQACKTSPCYVVPEVGRIALNGVEPCEGGTCEGFDYGTSREVDITCAAIGPATVFLRSTTTNLTPADAPEPVQDVTIELPVAGQCTQ